MCGAAEGVASSAVMRCLPASSLASVLVLAVLALAGGGCDSSTTGDGAGGAGGGAETSASPSAGSGVPAEEPERVAGITAAHNEVRANVSPAPASPMPPLTWDGELAAVAQAYAERCVFEHSSNDYGENLFASAGRPSTPQEVVTSWASEVSMYDYATGDCSGVCGHYTQVVWADSLRLGCGVATCTTGSPFEGFAEWEHWVCNYDPPGNWVGEKPY